MHMPACVQRVMSPWRNLARALTQANLQWTRIPIKLVCLTEGLQDYGLPE